MARDLILAGSVISILINPLVFALGGRRGEPSAKLSATKQSREATVVLIGHGRVGSRVAAELLVAGQRVTLVESSNDIPLPHESERLDLIIGNAASPQVLAEAAVAKARMLMVAIPEIFEAGQIIEQARRLNPDIQIVARAHSEAEVEYLTARGADRTIMGEEEIARRMSSLALAVR